MRERVNSKNEEKAKIFANRILGCRLRLALRQAEFAAKIGVSARAVQTWEAGINLPRPQQLRKIAEITGQRVEFLLGIDVPPSKDQQPIVHPREDHPGQPTPLSETGPEYDPLSASEKLTLIKGRDPELYRSLRLIVDKLFSTTRE